MSEANYEKLLDEIKELRTEINRRLEELAKDIKSEMNLKHQALDFKHEDHERRLTFTEKVMFSTGGIILVAVLYAVMRTVGL